jgi:hypothetical protein
VEHMLLSVQVTDLDWNVVLRMCRRITQSCRLLRLTRVRSVKKTTLKRMTDFDVTFKAVWKQTSRGSFNQLLRDLWSEEPCSGRRRPPAQLNFFFGVT